MTIKLTALLYDRAISDERRYRGKTRSDFDVLHQSMHEFGSTDKSELFFREIERAQDPAADQQGAAEIVSEDIPVRRESAFEDHHDTLNYQEMWNCMWPFWEQDIENFDENTV